MLPHQAITSANQNPGSLLHAPETNTIWLPNDLHVAVKLIYNGLAIWDGHLLDIFLTDVVKLHHQMQGE